MKFDDLLAQYLYEFKRLQLQEIGTFTLDQKISVPKENDKEIYYPIEGLSFKFNPKDVIDEDLVAFLVKKLAKIQPLVRSDLESYLSNMKQFINIGKPYTIEGVGTLSKNNQGIFEFTPGNFLPVKEELTPIRENPDHNYHISKRSNGSRSLLIFLIVLVGLAVVGGIAWGVYTLVMDQKASTSEVVVADDDTTTENTAVADTTLKQSVSLKSSLDSTKYKMVFEVTRLKARAIFRTQQLEKYRIKTNFDTIRVGDSLRYRLYKTYILLPKDTTRIKDSLSKYFGRRVSINID